MTFFQTFPLVRGAARTVRFSSQARAAGRRPVPIRCLLPDGQAATVQARQGGLLRISQGRVWLTFSHADQDKGVMAGDHFLNPGDSLYLPAGQAVVIEAWHGGASALEAPACIGWEAAARPGREWFASSAAGWPEALRLAVRRAGRLARLIHPRPALKAGP